MQYYKISKAIEDGGYGKFRNALNFVLAQSLTHEKSESLIKLIMYTPGCSFYISSLGTEEARKLNNAHYKSLYGVVTDLLSLTSSCLKSSLAPSETSLKFLTGKEYLKLMMLSLVRSKESTRNGGLPPRLRDKHGIIDIH